MSNELQKFNPQDFVIKVKEKVKNIFADLIPDDKWDELITTEINAFFSEPVKGLEFKSSYNYGETKRFLVLGENVSLFRSIVWTFCMEKTQNVLKNHLIENYYNSVFSPEKGEYYEEFKKLIQDSVPLAVDSYFKAIAAQSTTALEMHIKNAIQNGSYTNY